MEITLDETDALSIILHYQFLLIQSLIQMN